MSRARVCLAMGACAGLLATGAMAQPGARISLGAIATAQSCTTYVLSAGRSGIRVDAYGITAAASWRTWLQRDCVGDFPTIRSSIAAALAGSRRVQVTNRGTPGTYVLSAVVSAAAPTTTAVAGADFATAADRSEVVLTWTLRDPAGRVVNGGAVTESVETASTIQTEDLSTTQASDGQATYTKLEQGLALAVARKAAFAIEPLRVVGAGPDGIQLNYGTPLVPMGTAIQVQTRDGRFGRFSVVAAGDGLASAEPDGENAAAPGDRATVLESTDPAANGRRTRRVDLP